MGNDKEVIKYVSAKTGSGALILTEFYMVGDDEEEHFIAVKPIEVVSLGYTQDETGEIRESLIYRSYIRFSDDEECPITDIETVSKLSPSAEEYYLEKVKEIYPEKEHEVSEEIKDTVNVIIGNFSKNNKNFH